MPDCLTTAELAELRPGMALPERHFAHLAGCATCRKAVDAALRETEASDDAPADGPFDATLDAVPLEEPGRYRRARADGQPVLLGTGGFARVELARDEVIGRDVALKTLRSGQLKSPRRAVAERRLLQEARVVGQLEHPSIVPLYDLARTDDGQLFYAMRRIRGRTLADAIRAAGSLDERLRLLPHVLAACHAVAYAHSRGVLHRDLKPQNVMIDRFGETLVIDWGLASARGDDSHDDADLETSGVIRLVPGDQTVSDGRGRLGTPAYMSPEQLTGLRALVDARSDVFGLGSILYEVLTGQAPREHGPLQAAPKRVLEVTPTVPRDLAALCDKALESSRDARYQTAEELARDLDAWLHGLRVTAHAYRPLELARRFVRQHRYAMLVGLAAFLALVTMSIVSAVRVHDERNQARSFALLLAGDALAKLPFDERDPFRGDLTARVSSYLATTDEADDPAQAATAWARLASEFASISRNKEALHAAQRCLTLLPEVPTDERTEATRLMCEVTVVEESGRALPERLKALERLWERRRVQPSEPSLLNAQVALLLSLGHLASNTGDEAASVRWSNEAFEIARHVAVLEPNATGSWSQLGTAHYVRSIDALNAGQGAEAVSEARDAVDCARRAHQLQHSPHSLLRLADMLSDAYFAQELHPTHVRPGEHEATAREAQALFEALLALDDGAPVPRRRFSEFLVQRGDLTRAWELVAPVPITDFFHQRPKLYLALLVGQTELVLSEQAREPAASRSIDSAILPALAHAVKGDYRAAAVAARLGTNESFASHWPVEAMEAWSTKQRGPAAPALVRVAAELTAAQRANDEPRAHHALEAFAAELDALSR